MQKAITSLIKAEVGRYTISLVMWPYVGLHQNFYQTQNREGLMTKILDWRRAEDPRDVIHLAVQALAEGHLVAFPTDHQYIVAASTLRKDACDRLIQLGGTTPAALTGVAASKKNGTSLGESTNGQNAGMSVDASLLVRSADEIIDYVPDASQIAIRLAQRGWPGPLEIQLKGGHPTALTSQLNKDAVESISRPNGYLSFSRPHHESLEHVVRLSVGPLMTINAVSKTAASKGGIARSDSVVVTAEDVSNDVALAVDDGRAVSAGRSTVVRIDGSKCELVREGIVSIDNLVELTQFTVLFVCTGNTCRSPMAETILRSKLSERFADRFQNNSVPPIVVTSAGVSAGPGSPASDGAVSAMSAMGLDLSRHQSKLASQQLLERADWILTMTGGHRQAILARFPHVANKVYSLDPDGRDVSDPYGSSVDVYQSCALKISSYLDVWVDRLDENSMPVWDKIKEK